KRLETSRSAISFRTLAMWPYGQCTVQATRGGCLNAMPELLSCSWRNCSWSTRTSPIRRPTAMLREDGLNGAREPELARITEDISASGTTNLSGIGRATYQHRGRSRAWLIVSDDRQGV